MLPINDIKMICWGFPGGAVVESLPASAGDTGSSPGLGGSRMPRSGWAREPQLLSLRVWSLCPAVGGAAMVRGPRTAMKSGSRTAMKSGPHLPQLEEALARTEDPTQSKLKKKKKKRYVVRIKEPSPLVLINLSVYAGNVQASREDKYLISIKTQVNIHRLKVQYDHQVFYITIPASE